MKTFIRKLNGHEYVYEYARDSETNKIRVKYVRPVKPVLTQPFTSKRKKKKKTASPVTPINTLQAAKKLQAAREKATLKSIA